MSMKVDKHWVEGGELFATVSGDDREELVDNIRQFVMTEIEQGNLKRGDGTVDDLRSWANAGVEKVEAPQAFDPEQPDKDAHLLQSSDPKKVYKWRYKQTVRLTRPI
jgi:hypothetical protein